MTNIHDLVPAYVKDELNSDELRQFKEHLGACGSCQDDVALLGGRHQNGSRALRFERGSWIQFAAMVVAATIVVTGLAIYLG